MKYFTKALSIEGEIKEGDMTFRMGKVQKADLTFPKEYQKKAKLFLFSRDFEVGDTVTYYTNANVENGVVSKINSNKTFYLEGEEQLKIPRHSNTNWGKIIGEISPAAGWVKEGVEFDETQVELWTSRIDVDYHHDDIDEYWFLPLKYHIDSNGVLVNDMNKMDLKVVARIKGECGHFH